MTRSITYVDVFRPGFIRRQAAYDLSVVLAASFFVALLAQVSIRLPFTPVPITGQTFAVLFIGLLLGSRRGAYAILLYLGEGLVGLPVFAGGAAGPAYLLGPTGGYLLGFVGAAFLTGLCAERGWDRHFLKSLAALAAGNLVIFFCGALWLSLFVGRRNVWTAGVWPFLPGMVLKTFAAAILLPAGWRLVGKGRFPDKD